eukprot:CAMPEP_0194602318 /NCGR_PEP_ID=MMETSP0292-20121207/29579_1 /TAXON_ID=39354 /ORGANISM="Heterosigma akashiwo, Strain CCMP2393" /LENGTH=90 /DNA_ID=CAMNT_0039464539 /DNA_START=325 /DNA_END=593 /DNA_ORIENTATION=-
MSPSVRENSGEYFSISLQTYLGEAVPFRTGTGTLYILKKLGPVECISIDPDSACGPISEYQHKDKEQSDPEEIDRQGISCKFFHQPSSQT